VLEDVQDYASSAIDFNSVIRHDYAVGVIQRHRDTLLKYMPIRSHEIKRLNSAQVIFLLTIHDLEVMRSTEGLPSSLVSHFVNEGLNKPGELATCMDSIAEEVIRRCVIDLGTRVVEHGIASTIPEELRLLLIASCHRIAKARDVASKYLHRLISTFPSLLCNAPLVFAVLEVLTLLRKATEGQVTDEVNLIVRYSLTSLTPLSYLSVQSPV
jgi:phosphatidylinositol 4-kinase